MRLILISSILFLSACGIIQDRSTEYAHADAGKPLLIPTPYSDQKINARYPIPETDNKRTIAEKFELPKPPNATAALKIEPYTIEVLGDQAWLRLNMSPGKIWPLLDFFWSEHSVKIHHEEISQGYMMTKPYAYVYAPTKESLPDEVQQLSSKVFDIEGMTFQAKLVQGVKRSTAELQFRSIPAGNSASASTEWLAKSIDQDLDHIMLQLLGEFITSDTLQNRYSLLANDIAGDARIQLLKDKSGENFLRLELSFQRAWNELGKALKSAGVLVADIDLSQRSYYISYLDEDSIASWYQTSEHIAEKSKERNFSLTFSKENDGVIEIRVKQLNENLDPELGNELLNLIFEYIS